MLSSKIVLAWKIYCLCLYLTLAHIFKNKGSSTVLSCKYKALRNNGVLWAYSSSVSGPWTSYTSNTDIANVQAAPRITITGDFSVGEYKLNIRDLQKSDQGYYRCTAGGIGDGDPQLLIVIVGPTSVQIIGKTPDNKIKGTEAQTLHIHCNATGGSPPPDVKLLLAGLQVKTGTQAITYSAGTMDRSHDGQTVTCQTGYTSINDFPLADTSVLDLNLRPLVPNFNAAFLSIVELQQLEITCSSSGSRPAAVFHWQIDDANITGSSQITSSTLNPISNTYTVVSRLTYKLTKDHNRGELICKAINIAAPGGIPALPINVDVMYPPVLTVGNKTVTEETSPTVLTCTADGNPDTYTYYQWTHESLHGTLIRTLPGNDDGTLTLPNTNSSLQYQNTGRYNCTVGNEIPDNDTKRTGSGILTVQAPPVFALYNSWTQGGERGKAANISVYVYSLPTHSTVSWYRGNTLVSGNGYTVSTTQTSVRVMFHGKEVLMDGFKVKLVINEVKDSDLTTYRVIVRNTRGSNEETIKFVPFGTPDTPTNLADVNTTEHTITIQWTSGFDGGYEQIFVIQYRVTNTNNFQEVVVSGTSVVSHLESYFYTIAELKSGTKYDIRIFSRNVVGSSPPSKIITLSTICTCSKRESGNNSLIGVAVGLSTVTVISLVANGVFVFRMINGNTTPTKRDPRKPFSNKTSRPEVYYNVAENIDDKDAVSTIQMSTYEELGSKDKPNEYEELIKSSENISNINQAYNYETLGVTDQPNVYDDLDEKPKDPPRLV